MPRYFFDVSTNGRMHGDAIGVELQDDAEARGEAVGLLLALVEEAELVGDAAVIAINARGSARGDLIEARCEISVRTVGRR